MDGRYDGKASSLCDLSVSLSLDSSPTEGSHPLATIEYILIPLLMRCLKVTDELAASGTTRGLELECKRYALRPIRFAWPEIVVSLLGILFLVGLLFIDQTQIGKIILWRV